MGPRAESIVGPLAPVEFEGSHTQINNRQTKQLLIRCTNEPCSARPIHRQ